MMHPNATRCKETVKKMAQIAQNSDIDHPEECLCSGKDKRGD
jgi:hypothetical protein